MTPRYDPGMLRENSIAGYEIDGFRWLDESNQKTRESGAMVLSHRTGSLAVQLGLPADSTQLMGMDAVAPPLTGTSRREEDSGPSRCRHWGQVILPGLPCPPRHSPNRLTLYPH